MPPAMEEQSPSHWTTREFPLSVVGVVGSLEYWGEVPSRKEPFTFGPPTTDA